MLCKDLKVVNLNITEDFYEYKGLFRLCSDTKCVDIDLAALDEGIILDEIRASFELEEDGEIIKRILMEKVMEAAKIETRVVEGNNYNKYTKKNIEQGTDSLNRA